MNIAPEWVEDLPQDIDGMNIFKIKYFLREWVEKTQDLRYFKRHSSSRKGLIGTRKVGRCVHISHIQRLATMEVNNESTHEISLFWKLFNKILNLIRERLHIQPQSNYDG